jgi:hypothetical protein
MYVDKNTFDEEELEGYEGFTMLSKENNEIYFLIEKLEVFDIFLNHPIKKIEKFFYLFHPYNFDECQELDNLNGHTTIQSIYELLKEKHSVQEHAIQILDATIEFSTGETIYYSNGEFNILFSDFQSLVYYSCKILEACKYNAIETFTKILKYRGKHCSIYPTSDVNCDSSQLYIGNFNEGITPKDFDFDNFLNERPF